MMEKIANNPLLNLLSGIILLVSAGYETWDTLEQFSLGAHHGVLVFSLFHILQTLPDLLEGRAKLSEVRSTA
jgi:hypothetical protein